MGGLAAAAHLGVMRGVLKPHPSWGARPKVILGGLIGYFLGKFSYVDVCAEKFLIEAPDSNIAEAIRTGRGLASRRQEEQPQEGQEGPLIQPVHHLVLFIKTRPVLHTVSKACIKNSSRR